MTNWISFAVLVGFIVIGFVEGYLVRDIQARDKARQAKPPTPNPSDPDLRQQAVLLYYHDGAWEQAEVGGIYRAWSPADSTNVPVYVIHQGEIIETP